MIMRTWRRGPGRPAAVAEAPGGRRGFPQPRPGAVRAVLGPGRGPVSGPGWTPASAGTAAPPAGPGSGAAAPPSGRRRTEPRRAASGPPPAPASAGCPCSPAGGKVTRLYSIMGCLVALMTRGCKKKKVRTDGRSGA